MFGNNRINDLEKELSRLKYSSCPSEVKVNVTEQRAVTDESIRLANEMREKVLEDIIYSQLYNVNDNTLSYAFYVLKDITNPIRKVALAAVINGKRYIVEDYVDNLCKQETVEVETLDGEKDYKYKYKESQLRDIRLKMLAKLLLKAMYESNGEEFAKMYDGVKDEEIDNLFY